MSSCYRYCPPYPRTLPLGLDATYGALAVLVSSPKDPLPPVAIQVETNQDIYTIKAHGYFPTEQIRQP